MTVSTVCRPELWRRLTDSRLPFFEACEELARNRSDVAAALPALEALAAPCGSKAVVATLVPLVTLYGVSDKSEAEWKVFWGFYIKAMEELPLDALRAGVTDYTKAADSEFFPKPGPLLALCEKHAAPVRTALSRARRVSKSENPQPPCAA